MAMRTIAERAAYLKATAEEARAKAAAKEKAKAAAALRKSLAKDQAAKIKERDKARKAKARETNRKRRESTEAWKAKRNAAVYAAVAAEKTKPGSTYLTLGKLRDRQPKQDRDHAAFKAKPAEHRLFDPNIDPVTHEEAVAWIRSEAGAAADPIIAECEWSAIRSWLMSNWSQRILPKPMQTLWFAVELVSFAQRDDAGYPLRTDSFSSAALYDLPDNLQREAKLLAEEVRTAWFAAECPRLSATRCRGVLDHMTALAQPEPANP